jgi:hypothetical protein
LLAVVLGERVARDAGWILENPVGLPEAEAELELEPGRVVLYSASSAEVRVHSLDGKRLGRLRADPPAGTQGLPLRDAEWILYLGGQPQSSVHEVHLGPLPVQGNLRTRRFILPGPVPIRSLEKQASEVAAPWPLALRCGGEILLRLERGWARLALGPGKRYRRQSPPPRAPRFEGQPPATCRPLRPLLQRQQTPVERALLDEVWLGGVPFLLGAPRVPPPYLVLVSPERRRVRWLGPPEGSAVAGSAVRSGRYVLFHGRACGIGELRLTLADLEDPRWRPSLWSTVLPIARRGCRPGPIAAQICSGAAPVVRIEEAGRVATYRAEDGASVPDPGVSGCKPFGELRRDAAAWEAARTLQVGSWRYRLEPGPGGRLLLLAGEGGASSSPRWQRSLDAPAYLLGATDDAVLLVAKDVLEVRERSSGAVRSRQRLAALRTEPSEPAPVCRFIGGVGRRAYFLVQARTAELVFFDGERALPLR